MKLFTVVRLIVLCCLLSGRVVVAGQPGPVKANVFAAAPQLPSYLKRVLVLPVASDEFAGPLSDGCKILDPVLNAALVKTGKFEAVPADSEVLCRCTGRSSWTGAEVLPTGFFDSLKNIYGCDAVLFCQLTEFRSSPPLAIGWRLKLVDADTGKILWATDEIFDAGNLAVARDAQRFEKREQPHQSIFFEAYSFVAWCLNTPTRSALDDQWNILHSPRYFGEYSVQQLLETLPRR